MKLKNEGTTELRLPIQPGVTWRYEVKDSEARYAAIGKKLACGISSFLNDWYYAFKYIGAHGQSSEQVLKKADELIADNLNVPMYFPLQNKVETKECFSIEGQSGDPDLETDIAFAMNGRNLCVAVFGFIQEFNEVSSDLEMDKITGQQIYDLVQKLISEHFDKVHSVVKLVQ